MEAPCFFSKQVGFRTKGYLAVASSFMTIFLSKARLFQILIPYVRNYLSLCNFKKSLGDSTVGRPHGRWGLHFLPLWITEWGGWRRPAGVMEFRPLLHCPQTAHPSPAPKNIPQIKKDFFIFTLTYLLVIHPLVYMEPSFPSLEVKVRWID